MYLEKVNTEKSDLYLLNGTSEGKPAWFYLKMDKLKLPIFKFKVDSKDPNINLENFGVVIASGWGDQPPTDIKAEIEGWDSSNEDIDPGDYTVHYLNAHTDQGEPVFYYLAVKRNETDLFKAEIKKPEFDLEKVSVILLSGYGQPTSQIKLLMQREYGVEHTDIDELNQSA